MEREKCNVVLIALEAKERDYYRSLLSGYKGTNVEEYSTIHQFKKCCPGRKYSGIVVDIRTLIRSTMQEREFFSLLWDGFPVLHISQSTGSNELNCLLEGQESVELKGKELLDHFIEVKCRKVVPRQVRVHTRKKVFLNTFLYLTKDDKNPLKTNLWDISEGGSFVISTKMKPEGEQVWLKFADFNDKTPICGIVRWHRPWGKNFKQLPGFGIEFEKLSAKQLIEIRDIKKIAN